MAEGQIHHCLGGVSRPSPILAQHAAPRGVSMPAPVPGIVGMSAVPLQRATAADATHLQVNVFSEKLCRSAGG